MKAVIIAVGNEVTSGDVVNTNGAYIADFLKGYGIKTAFQIAVTDKAKDIKKAVKKSLKKADLVITTGGLGPTYDDITKKSVAEVFGLKLEKNEKILKDIQEYFSHTGREMSKSNEAQAYFPSDALIIPNGNGTAPGAVISSEGKTVMMFPGPPCEMTLMLESSVVTDYLSSLKDCEIKETVLRLFGIGESAVQDILSDCLNVQKDVIVAPYIKTGEVELKITVRAKTAQETEEKTAEIKNIIKEKVGEYIFSEENLDLEEALVKKLKEKRLTLITVESCTGGLIGKKITDVSGASEVYEGGLITYSNEMKKALCGVKEETLAEFGAVSKGTAIEMAEGARKAHNCDIAVSVTGVAGPSCSEEKPVGLVYIGVSAKEESYAKRFNFNGNREKIREQTAKNALYLALCEANKEK